MTSDFRVGITVRQPRSEVAAVMFNPHYLPAWYDGVHDVDVLTGTPPEEGATIALSRIALARFRGRDMFTLVEHLPNLSLALRSETTTLKFELEGVPVGTIAWMACQIERTGLRRLVRRWVDHRARRAGIRDLRRLKRFIESGEHRTWLSGGEEIA